MNLDRENLQNIGDFSSADTLVLESLQEKKTKGREMVNLYREVVANTVREGRKTREDAQVMLAALDALETACNEADALQRALSGNRSNNLLLQDAQAVVSKLEAAISQVEEYK